MISISYPHSGMVFQRGNDGAAYINVRGSADTASVVVTFSPLQSGWAPETATQNVSVTNGKFDAWIRVKGGDYILTVSGNGQSTQVQPIGVGEVLMLWGHSFIGGDPATDRDALDPRSRTCLTQRSANNPDEPTRLENLDVLPMTFGKISLAMGIGPFSTHTWMWGAFADELVNRLNVPVLIYSAAFGGSSVTQNVRIIKGQYTFEYDWFNNISAYRMPYRPVEAVVQKYAQLTGLRGVICEHGGNDQGPVLSGENSLADTFPFVVNHTRKLLGHEKLIWTVSLEGNAFLNANATLVNDQLKQVLASMPYAYKGIDLSDPSTVGPWRDNGGTGHYRGIEGFQKYLALWLNAIKPDFFTASVPYTINPPTSNNSNNFVSGVTSNLSMFSKALADAKTAPARWWQNEYVQWAALIIWAVGLVTLALLMFAGTKRSN